MPPSARRPCARTSPMAATPGRCHTAFLRRCHPGAGMTLPPRVQTVLAGRPPKNRKLRARPSTAQHTPSGCRRCIPSGRECRRSPRFGTWCPPSTAASRQVHVISGCFPQKYFDFAGLHLCPLPSLLSVPVANMATGKDGPPTTGQQLRPGAPCGWPALPTC